MPQPVVLQVLLRVEVLQVLEPQPVLPVLEPQLVVRLPVQPVLPVRLCSGLAVPWLCR